MLPARDDVKRFHRAVERGIPEPLVSGPDLDRLGRLLDRVERGLGELAQKRLVVALLGGTGVGKSTLLNAVAGSTISETGDRRPTTDRVVCYRHRDFPIPEWLDPRDISDPGPPPHDIPHLRGVVLLDLPDIDSREPQHRKIVHRLLPRLDLLVVVASVDKYGDRLLYGELRSLPQAPRNLVFVLNAIDRLLPDELPRVRRDFIEKLSRHSLSENPTVFAVSARAVCESQDPSPDGDFPKLMAYLEALGESSQRTAVLAANVEESLERMENCWNTAVPATEVEKWLQRLGEIPRELPAPDGITVAAFEDHLADVIRPWVTERALQASWFPIGPMHFLTRGLRPGRAKRRSKSPLAAGDPCGAFTDQILLTPLRLAAHEAQSVLRALGGKLTLALPESRVPDEAFLVRPVAPWWERLGRQSPRWAWKGRQHVLPVLFLLFWASWVIARVSPGPGEDTAWWRTLLGALWAAASSASPLTLAVTAAAVVLYYLSIYPYFLYRLERNVRREAERGAKTYLAAWREAFARLWGIPFEERVSAAAKWWEEARSLFEKARLKR